jgi:type I restriction enzyme R subunit
MKTQDIDLVIVVNMFLTGFDSTTLNTLWVDKNLRLHGLIQAFSRTNRILNSVKTYGNIVCFRDLEENTKEAISIFGDKEAGGIVLLKAFSEYFDEYSKLISELTSKFDPDKPPVSEKEIKEFISLYNQVLRLRNILVSFDDFSGKDLLTEAQLQDYQSTYLLIYQDEKNKVEQDKESILEDIIFEIELVKQIQINVDYILMLVGDLQKTKGDKNKELRSKIDKTINSSFVLRSKKDLIIEFIDSINNQSNVEELWKEFIEEQKRKELDSLIIEDNLDPEATKVFMEKSISQGELKTSGTAISKLLPARDIFSPNYEYGILKAIVIDKLQKFFERFSNL